MPEIPHCYQRTDVPHGDDSPRDVTHPSTVATPSSSRCDACILMTRWGSTGVLCGAVRGRGCSSEEGCVCASVLYQAGGHENRLPRPTPSEPRVPMILQAVLGCVSGRHSRGDARGGGGAVRRALDWAWRVSLLTLNGNPSNRRLSEVLPTSILRRVLAPSAGSAQRARPCGPAPSVPERRPFRTRSAAVYCTSPPSSREVAAWEERGEGRAGTGRQGGAAPPR